MTITLNVKNNNQKLFQNAMDSLNSNMSAETKLFKVLVILNKGVFSSYPERNDPIAILENNKVVITASDLWSRINNDLLRDEANCDTIHNAWKQYSQLVSIMNGNHKLFSYNRRINKYVSYPVNDSEFNSAIKILKQELF